MPDETIDSEMKRISSAIATGGSGTFFEQHVNACYLAVLLVCGAPPVLTNCVLVEVALQAEHLGWNTDDLVLTGQTGTGSRRRLAIQVKRAFIISKSNEDCVKAIRDFWIDFNHTGFFVEGQDALGLCVQAGNGDSAVVRIRSLSDIARASKDADDFNNRLLAEGFTSAAVKKAAAIIKEIVGDIGEVEFSEGKFWRFIKSLHAFTLDLNTSTGQTESLVRTLLSLTATGQDKTGEAQLSWNELLVLVGKGMPRAETFNRNKLPDALQLRHTQLGSSATNALAKAREHSQTTIRGIRTLLGKNTALARSEVVSSMLDAMSESPLVLVTGPAGSGKSALAKLGIEELGGDSFVLSFRAEEFAAAHIDQTLQHAQIPANNETLQGLLAGQARKVLLIESVERLLEASTRDAFLDLLGSCAGDGTWRVVLTCRDYSVDIVRSSFLDHLGLTSQIIRVPPLSDSEIDEVVKAVPSLARPASHPFLRELFRTPYILDKAARMCWPEGDSLPNDERAFRRKFWSEIVRRDDQAQNAFPKRRQETFIELCLRRAKALEPFAPTGGLDGEVLQLLRKDGLVEFSPSGDTVAAPTHDLLEDWAVIEWIRGRFAALGSDGSKFATELGTSPAVRRGNRKWLGECLATAPSDADSYVIRIVSDGSLPAHFRDDTLVAVLTSSAGGEFLKRNGSLLTSHGGALLRRVIHLVRVACKTTPPWAKKAVVPTWFVPSGPAWPAVLRLVREELSLFVPREVGLVAGLLSDWASGIVWWENVPAGANDAVSIAHALLPLVDDYSSKDLRKTVLGVIVKAPSGDLVEFSKLADRATNSDRDDQVAKEFGELLLSGLECSFACRDAPDDVIKVSNAYILTPTDEGSDDYRHEVDIGANFGVEDDSRQGFFPASALQGPFLSLLKNHSAKALAFIINLLNRACEAYANPEINRRLEQPVKIQLKLPDGTEKTYWCNWRLWALYRGFSVGPYVLQSALMALESFLLDLCQIENAPADDWLTHILRQSNNVALVAVVASIASADPYRAGKAAISVLSNKALIDLDRSRRVAEMQGQFKMPLPSAMQRIVEGERATANAQAHRKCDLEWLAFRLQFTPLATEVRTLLDNYKQALPEVEKQTEEDKLFRLALNRMDLRNFRAQEEVPKELADQSTNEGNPENQSRIYLVPQPLEAELQAVVDDKAPEQKRFNEVTSLFLWGHNAFEHEPNAAGQWQERLKGAKELAADSGSTLEQWAIDAPVFVAAVCVRDHWTELSKEDRDWCLNQLVASVRRDADTTDLATQMSASSLEGAGPAASVLPLVLNFGIDALTKTRVIDTLAIALTHSVSKVPLQAAAAIGWHLGATEPELTHGLIRLIVMDGIREEELYKIEQKKPYVERWQYEDIRRQVRQELRTGDSWKKPCTAAELSALDLHAWSGKRACKALMPLLMNCPGEPLAKQAFLAVALTLAEAWTDKEDKRERRDYYFESDCEVHLSRFVLKLALVDAAKVLEPILKSVDKAPKEAGDFVKQLIYGADATGSAVGFWPLWGEFADRCVKASWLDRLEDRYSRDEGLLRAMFLNIHWKDGVPHFKEGTVANGPQPGPAFEEAR